MKVFKGEYPNGEKMYTAVPTSTKELRQAFLSFGISAWVMKMGNVYDILYPNPRSEGGPFIKTVPTKCVDGFTLKGWIDVAKAYAPEKNIMHEEYRQMPGWPNYLRYYEKETLQSPVRMSY